MSADSGTGPRDSWVDSPWTRALIGFAFIGLWVLLVFAVGNLGGFIRSPDSERQSGIPWLVVGTLGFGALAWFATCRSRSGKPLVPIWSSILLWILSGLWTLLFLALNDEGAMSSHFDRPTTDVFVWPRLEEWATELSFPVTLLLGVLVVANRVLPLGRTATKWLITAAGIVPFPVLAALIAPLL